MNKKFAIGTKVREILIADDTVTSKVADRVFPIDAPKDAKGDFVIYMRDKYDRAYNNMGFEDTAHIILVAASKKYDRSQSLAEAVDDAMEAAESAGEFKMLKLLDSSEDHDADTYFNILIYSIL